MPDTEAKPYPVQILDAYGVISNKAPSSIPDNALTDALNVKLKDGRVLAAPGWTAFVSAALDSRFMHADQFFQRSGLAWLIAISKTKTYLYDSVTETFSSIQAGGDFTGDDDQFFETDTPFDTFIITNLVDVARKWTGTGNIQTLGGLTDVEPAPGQVSPVAVTAAIIRAFQDFVVLFNTIENGVPCPQRVRWGRKSNLENYKNDASGNGQAGSNDLSNDVGFILTAHMLQNYMAIYKERSIYLMSYVGPPIIFSFVAQITGIGVIAQRAVADLGDEHAFLGNDNFYIFNGISITPIGDPIKNRFFQELDPGYRNRIQAFIVEEQDEIWWIYSSVNADDNAGALGDPDRAVVWNYASNAWYFHENFGTYWFYYTQSIQYTWDTIPDLSWEETPGAWDDSRLVANFPVNLFGKPDGTIKLYGTVYAQDGADYVKLFRTKLYDFGRPGVKKRLKMLQMLMSTGYAGNFVIRVGHCENPGDAITWSAEKIKAVAVGANLKLSFDITDVYFIFEFQTKAKDELFDVLGFIPWFEDRTSQ